MALEESLQDGVRAQGGEDGNKAADGVREHEGGHVAEGGDKDEPCEFGAARDGEVFGYGGGDGGTEALADDGDAIRGDARDV